MGMSTSVARCQSSTTRRSHGDQQRGIRLHCPKRSLRFTMCTTTPQVPARSQKKKPSIPYGALASSMLPTEERARLDAANDTKADADDDIPIPGPTPHFDKRFSSA